MIVTTTDKIEERKIAKQNKDFILLIFLPILMLFSVSLNLNASYAIATASAYALDEIVAAVSASTSPPSFFTVSFTLPAFLPTRESTGSRTISTIQSLLFRI